ncbi:MAG: hypothetical protein A4E65_02306 [Syntrophorhabdus sp. PtaU1.Bin153]|nr:MAG: hypothetical protein A4E65_02306 [Syntrophorhabdus sp. PtaU1.Bin153]
MAAVNKFPFVKNLRGAEMLTFPGKVQAGSTQAIKAGEICTYDETSGYFIPADAVADRRYSLAIANEEQKADGLARYMEFIALRPDDVFEFAVDAAAQLTLGDGLELTASDSQKLTRDVDGDAVAVVVGKDNYPETGTTLGYRSYAQVSFLPVYSYWEQNVLKGKLKKLISTAADITLKPEDCGAVVFVTAAKTVTLPSATVPIGWNVTVVVGADAAVVIDPKPDTACIYIKGAKQAAGKYISMTDIADYVELMWDGTDWIAVASLSGADADITVET